MADKKIDWSQFEVKNANAGSTDWSQYEVQHQPEQSVEEEAIAIPEITGLTGLGSDVLDAGLKALDFAEDIPNKLEKSGKYIQEHPGKSVLHNFGQVAAETADIGKGIINAPYNLNQYLARKHLLPQLVGKLGKLIPHLPEDTGVEKALGLEADPDKGDELFRAIPDIASMAFGGKSVGGQAKRFLKAPDLKQALKDTQSKVNATNAKLGKNFDKVEEQVEKRGVKPIPISKDTIDRAKRFLDKSPETKELIAKASKGDYKALRAIQSDLRVIGEDALSNKLSTERAVGKEALSARNKINSDIEQHFEKTGHQDLADILKTTKEGYKDLQSTYFSSPALARVFGKSQKLPKNPMTLLTEDSTQMTKFFKTHPEMKTLLEKALKHGRNKKILKSIGKFAVGGATAGGTYKALNGH